MRVLHFDSEHGAHIVGHSTAQNESLGISIWPFWRYSSGDSCSKSDQGIFRQC